MRSWAKMKKGPWTCGGDGKYLSLPPGKGASCWICLGEGPDDGGEPLRRDCSCRGGSGHAHLSCLVRYGEEHNQRCDGCDMDEISKPWTVCPICRQEYQNKLAIDLADKFVTFTKRKYPDGQQRLLRALFLKLTALGEQSVNYKMEREKVANDVLSTIELMRTKNPTLPRGISLIEAEVYNEIGRVYHLEGTKEGARKAVENFEKSRDINKEFGDTAITKVAESNIAAAETIIYGSAASRTRRLRKQQELYDHRIAIFGDGSQQTIPSGLILADALFSVNRRVAAERLVAKLAVVSNRAHGPGHRVTRSARSRLQSYKIKRVIDGLRECVILMLTSLILWFIQILFHSQGPSRSFTDEEINREIEILNLGSRVYIALVLGFIMLDFYDNSR